MDKATRKTLTNQLTSAQSGARARVLETDEMISEATILETFLRRSSTPIGVSVHTNWSRVASSYRGIPVGTIVRGTKSSDGIKLDVLRTRGAFGNREWTIGGDRDFSIRGKNAHSSGATDNLLATTVEEIDTTITKRTTK